MKTYLSILITMLIGLSSIQLSAQEEMKYLFGGEENNIKVSGFAGVFNEFSSVDGDFAFSMGGGAAMLFNQKFYLGAYGMGLTTRHLKSYIQIDPSGNLRPDDQLYTRFGHGGLWLGYIHKPQNAIHWGVNTKIGWGGITLNDLVHPGSDYKWENYYSDNVFVLSPEVNVGFNLLKWMRVDLGVGYRLVTGVDDIYGDKFVDGDIIQVEAFESDAFNSVTGSVTLAFGWFNK